MTDPGKRMSEIRDYWDRQAREHGAELAATNPDVLAKELEVRALRGALDPALDVLEAGCGNGYNLFALADAFSGRLAGFDYAPAMVDAARERAASRGDKERFGFSVASILDDLSFLGTFPQVFTDRCLINLPSLDLQLEALRNLAALVAPGGRLVLVESTRQGQDRLNDLREIVGLHRIPYHWHNLYLDETEFLGRVPAGLRHVATDNFASLYFVISRVFNARLTPEGQEPDYLADINKIACELPSSGDFAPLKLFAFEKA